MISNCLRRRSKRARSFENPWAWYDEAQAAVGGAKTSYAQGEEEETKEEEEDLEGAKESSSEDDSSSNADGDGDYEEGNK